ncbi:MAG: hypothetical protein IPJ34_23225 [Myxococcales bacterium]|nr:hypothetical protein [Myxococcales bacterium]
MGNWFVGFPFVTTDPLPTPPDDFTRFHGDDLHVTLAFLGGCGEGAARAAWRATLEAVAAGLLVRRRVTLGEVVPLGPTHRFSALSARLHDGRAQVEAAMTRTRDPICDAAGAARELRPALAHVTLARPARGASAERRDEGLAWAAALDLRAIGADLGEVSLYARADLGAGARFRRIETLRLP